MSAAPEEPGTAPTSLHAAFRRAAADHPDRVAVRDGHRELTYAELDAVSGSLAAHLRRTARGPYVGLALRPGLHLVTAVLAVLRAGKAYVPVDPDSPPERMRRILEQFLALPLLAEDEVLPGLPALPGVRPVRISEAMAAADGLPPLPSAEPPFAPAEPHPESPAYVIFTSGSTGVPKGVVVSHHNVLRLFRSCARHLDFRPDDVWCLFHSPAFDFSVWELFGPLLHGGRLEIVPPGTKRTPADFARFLGDRAVTVLNQTPSAFRQLCTVLTPEQTHRLALRRVVLGGERLDPGALRPWYALAGDAVELINMYGITETTVHVTCARLSPRDAEAGGPGTIGRPLPDLEVRVVDERLRPVPDGTPGELLVSGAGLALGYLGDPAMTAARFREDVEPGRRWYRSGDEVLRTADGDLVYLGRLDRQTKLNGYRIELGEVETALRGLPGVLDCHVLLDTAPPAPRLVAHLVLEEAVPVETVRDSLARTLPAYMVPTVYVPVPELPLTLNGKVDEKALLARSARG
ncbi:amino acid adenylation domain-containing protein [Kitasatospora sp. NPDC001309]|uniref:amino acid adenylation domain-containing protein n=1 Tax=unclassified Kitasatospora TaxID=2633591 RepID=UPI0036C370D5